MSVCEMPESYCSYTHIPKWKKKIKILNAIEQCGNNVELEHLHILYSQKEYIDEFLEFNESMKCVRGVITAIAAHLHFYLLFNLYNLMIINDLERKIVD